jgi:hypothetical protein
MVTVPHYLNLTNNYASFDLHAVDYLRPWYQSLNSFAANLRRLEALLRLWSMRFWSSCAGRKLFVRPLDHF